MDREVIEHALWRAIHIAKKLGWGRVTPNPLVGCVVIDKQGSTIAEGAHRVFGGPHAEVDALANLTAEQLTGATVVVTLEPCAHFGKTPPCADLLASLPLAHVVYGIADPNPKVSGKGHARIASSGIQVQCYSDLKEADGKLVRALNELPEVFLINVQAKRTFMAGKLATSLDGFAADVDGQSQWITGEVARQYGHYLRAGFDAIMVGAETFQVDNPQLNIRISEYADKVPTLIVVDPHLRTIAHLAKQRALQFAREVIYVTHVSKLMASNTKVKMVGLPFLEGKQILDLSTLATKLLHEHGIASALIEGGPSLISHLLNQRCLDRMYQFVAPFYMGHGRSIGQNILHPEPLTNRLSGTLSETIVLEQDMLVSLKMNITQ